MDEVSTPQAARPRRTGIAFLLGVLAPGLGHVYAGAMARAFLALAFLLALLPVGVMIRVLLDFSPTSVIAGFVVFLLLVLLIPLDAALTARRRRNRPPGRWNRVWFYVVWAVLSSLVFDTVGRWELERFWFRNFKIPSGAMMDTLLIGDYIFGDMRKGKLFPIQRGDIVIFLNPHEPATTFIKRVVGLPGETVELREGLLYIDGDHVAEPYVNEDYRIRDPKRQFGPIRVREGHFFVLGDHRNMSADSRYWGQVPRANLKGRARSIWWSYQDPAGVVFGSTRDRLAHWIRGPVRVVKFSRWERMGRSLETRRSAER